MQVSKWAVFSTRVSFNLAKWTKKLPKKGFFLCRWLPKAAPLLWSPIKICADVYVTNVFVFNIIRMGQGLAFSAQWLCLIVSLKKHKLFNTLKICFVS